MSCECVQVAGIFFYNVVQCRCIAYNVIALLAEVNSAFLHARKLLHMSGYKYTGWLYRITATGNLITFIPCRFGGLAWIIYGMTQWSHRVGRIYLYLLGVAVVVLWLTNVILYWRLICSDLLRWPQKSKRATAAASPVASSVHCNGDITSDHDTNDVTLLEHQQNSGVVNGPLANLHRRGKDTVNGTL